MSLISDSEFLLHLVRVSFLRSADRTSDRIIKFEDYDSLVDRSPYVRSSVPYPEMEYCYTPPTERDAAAAAIGGGGGGGVAGGPAGAGAGAANRTSMLDPPLPTAHRRHVSMIHVHHETDDEDVGDDDDDDDDDEEDGLENSVGDTIDNVATTAALGGGGDALVGVNGGMVNRVSSTEVLGNLSRSESPDGLAATLAKLSAVPSNEMASEVTDFEPKVVVYESALTRLLEQQQTAVENPFSAAYSMFGGAGEVNPLSLDVYLPHSANPSEPMRIILRRSATVEQTIGYILYQYVDLKRKPALDKVKYTVAAWTLRIAEDDGTIDDDFPAPDRSRQIARLQCTEFALCEASEAQFRQNLASMDGGDRRGSTTNTAAAAAATGLGMSQLQSIQSQHQQQQRQQMPYPGQIHHLPPVPPLPPPPPLPPTSSTQPQAPLTISTTRTPTWSSQYTSQLSAAPVSAPGAMMIPSGFHTGEEEVYTGPKRILRVHVSASSEALRTTSISVPEDMPIARILNHICRKWSLNPGDFILRTNDRDVPFAHGALVRSLPADTELCLMSKEASLTDDGPPSQQSKVDTPVNSTISTGLPSGSGSGGGGGAVSGISSRLRGRYTPTRGSIIISGTSSAAATGTATGTATAATGNTLRAKTSISQQLQQHHIPYGRSTQPTATLVTSATTHHNQHQHQPQLTTSDSNLSNLHGSGNTSATSGMLLTSNVHFTVTRRSQLFASQYRTLIFDADTLHIAHGESRNINGPKMAKYTAATIVSCKQSERNPARFKLIVLKERAQTKAYDFEASSAQAAKEICELVRQMVATAAAANNNNSNAGVSAT
ncbi:SIN1-domain-containing protein [Ramicandelaber brevisporus]|nr:SIN1-domain-containing protein [Ramicandelaber brevisporus]